MDVFRRGRVLGKQRQSTLSFLQSPSPLNLTSGTYPGRLVGWSEPLLEIRAVFPPIPSSSACGPFYPQREGGIDALPRGMKIHFHPLLNGWWRRLERKCLFLLRPSRPLWGTAEIMLMQMAK